MTLIEALISVSLLGILTGAILSMYFMTTSVVSHGRARSELMGELQLANSRMMRDLEGAIYTSCSFDLGNHAFSMLSARAPNGSYELQVDGEVFWQKYIVYYRAADNVVYRREVPLNVSATQRLNPTPIESYDPGTGTSPLSGYLSDGRPVARSVTLLEAVLTPERSVRVKLQAESPAEGRRRAQKVTLESVAYPRN